MAGLDPAISRRTVPVEGTVASQAMTEQERSAGGEIEADIAARTDSYFTRTRKIVERFGDKPVTYAIFLRRPAICAPRLMDTRVKPAYDEYRLDARPYRIHPVASAEASSGWPLRRASDAIAS